MKITTLSSAGSFLDGFDISIISVAILTIAHLYSLTTTEETLLLGSTLLGMVFGGLSIGYLTDIKGRRFVFLWDMVIFILFTFLTAISLNYTQLLIFRLLLGVAIGADYAITPTIIAEFAPAKHRGKLLSFSGGGMVYWCFCCLWSRVFDATVFSCFGGMEINVRRRYHTCVYCFDFKKGHT